ncbi:MAG TPA: anti-sigma factor [Dehalococcoidia bacterium]|nr:anti-sigma factor [Dehalococcoidia bacterium]
MDCAEAIELLDAHALGALDKREAAQVERHVAGCLSCWEELGRSQRTAALLSMSVPIHKAPLQVRERIMARAERDGVVVRGPSLLQRLRPNWRTTAGALGFAVVSALVFSSFLQVQMSNLRGDKNELGQQLSTAASELEQQKQIVAVLSASDNRKISVQPTSLSSQAESVYNWSRENSAGFIVCHDFPPLSAGRVYQVWFTTSDSVEPVATFVPQGGGCQIPMDMSRLSWRPEGIGISVEPEGGSASPSSRWFAYAAFERSPEGGSGRGGGGGGGVDMVLAAIGP